MLTYICRLPPMTEEIEAEGYHRNLSSSILSFLSGLTIYISEGVDIEFMLALSNHVSLSGKVENFVIWFSRNSDLVDSIWMGHWHDYLFTGPYAVVMAPTRELAQQIEEETVKFAHFLVSSCEIVLFISSILCQGENTLMIRILSIYLHQRATRLCILIQIFNNPKPFNQLEKNNITMT